MKHRQEDRERQQIECRRHATHHQSKPQDLAKVPCTRAPEIFPVDVIERNADFGRVVEQVVEQNLHRQERKKRQHQ